MHDPVLPTLLEQILERQGVRVRRDHNGEPKPLAEGKEARQLLPVVWSAFAELAAIDLTPHYEPELRLPGPNADGDDWLTFEMPFLVLGVADGGLEASIRRQAQPLGSDGTNDLLDHAGLTIQLIAPPVAPNAEGAGPFVAQGTGGPGPARAAAFVDAVEASPVWQEIRSDDLVARISLY